jgi:nitroreductase
MREFREVVVNRRSIRKFKKDPVSEENLNSILEAGRWSPSAGNTQPWHFIVVTNEKAKAKIAGICTKYSRKHWKIFPPERARYLAARNGTWDKSYMKEIPVLLVVCCEIREDVRNELAMASVWMAVENMLLAATDEGIGSCVYTFLNEREENELKHVLDVPQTHGIACMIQLGQTDAQPAEPSRKKLEEIVSYERF